MRKLLFVVVLLMIFYPKVIKLDGTVIASPLDVANVEWSKVSYVQGQHRLGEATLTLIPPIGADAWRHDIYDLLDAEQRVEVYDNEPCIGTPWWTGVIKALPSSSDNQWQVQCDGISHRLDKTFTRQYQQITGNARDAILNLLKRYELTLGDDFSSGAFAPNWQFLIAGANYSIVNGAVESTDDGSDRMQTAIAYTPGYWKNSWIAFDYYFASDATIGADNRITAYWDFANVGRFSIIHPNAYVNWTDTVFDESSGNQRAYPVELDVWNHIDIYLSTNGVTNTGRIYLNGLEMLTTTITVGATNNRIEFEVTQNGATPIRIDNFIFATQVDALTPGDIDATVETVNLEANGSSHLELIETICDQLGWTYRIRPQAGEGNDIFDAGVTPGYDWSDVFTLEEGINILQLDIEPNTDQLATLCHVKAQSDDNAASSYIAVDIAQIRTYGLIETRIANECVVDAETARVIAQNYLAIAAQAEPSISGLIEDETALFEQDPVWGYMVWGDFIWGGRVQLTASDTVRLKSDRTIPRTDRDARIVEERRHSENAIDTVGVTFDHHTHRKGDEEQRFRRELALTRRSAMRRMDTRSVRLSLSGTTAQTWSFRMLGNYRNVRFSIHSAAWAGAITVTINGTDRTAAIFGAATIGANADVDDTAYLVLSGDYAVVFTPTQSVVLDISLTANLLG